MGRYVYDTKLRPVRIIVTVEGETKSVVAYVTQRELDQLIKNPNMNVEIED